MGKLPPGYTVTKLRHIDDRQWYALDLRKPHKPHVLPLAMKNFQLAKRWLISQKYYLPDQVQLITGAKVLEYNLPMLWDSLPFLALPRKYPGHLGFGKSTKDWKESIRKEIKASEEGWKRVRQITFRLFKEYYVIYTWESKHSLHVKRIIRGFFDRKRHKTIYSKMKDGPVMINPKTRWLSGIQRNPSPIMINRFNKEHRLPPIDRFPFDGKVAMRWKGFIQENAPLTADYLEPIL
jgi:hypothetical protein